MVRDRTDRRVHPELLLQLNSARAARRPRRPLDPRRLEDVAPEPLLHEFVVCVLDRRQLAEVTDKDDVRIGEAGGDPERRIGAIDTSSRTTVSKRRFCTDSRL